MHLISKKHECIIKMHANKAQETPLACLALRINVHGNQGTKWLTERMLLIDLTIHQNKRIDLASRNTVSFQKKLNNPNNQYNLVKNKKNLILCSQN